MKNFDSSQAPEPRPKRLVLGIDPGFRSMAVIAGLAGIGGATIDRIIEAVTPKGPSGKHQERSGPPVLKGKRLARLKKQMQTRGIAHET